METIIIGLLIVVLVASAFFNAVTWVFNWIAVGVLAVVWVVLMYNRFVRLVNQAKEAWSDIQVQLKRRYDLIPNLVATVKGYATHESSAFENVTKARAAAMGATGTAGQAQAENMLSGALKSLFAVSEAYPDLKANQNFLQLQQELGDTEDKIQASRRFYNTTVMALNTALQSFPSNIIASIFSFKHMDLFELGADEQAAKQPVKVQF
ncbi:LemA family protein [Candidatus Kaiserbacteria bacterium]|nr:LemA family protein [Candidatus Kaiserbacteria bacterium]